MSTVGVILITVGILSTVGDIMMHVGYHEYRGGVQYRGRGMILCNLSTVEGYHDKYRVGYHEYRGVFSTVAVLN